MATNPHTLNFSDRMKWLREHTKGQRVQLGPYKFWINPASIDHTTEWLYAEAPTLGGGWGVWDFGTKPYEFTLEGTTGTMGEFDIDDKTGLASVAPRFNVANKRTKLTIPGRTSWDVYVIRIQDHIAAEKPNFYYYTIDLKVYGEAKSSYTKVYAASSVTNSVPGPVTKAPTSNTKGVVSGGATTRRAIAQ